MGLTYGSRLYRNSNKKVVRVLVFQDSTELFRNALNEATQNTQISQVSGSEPSLFVLGPLKDVKGDKESTQRAGPVIAISCTRRWPLIHELKVEKIGTQVEQSIATLVYVGAAASRGNIAWKGGSEEETK